MASVRELGSRLLFWRRRPAGRHEPGAQAAAFAAEPFTDRCIAIAPTAPGVYLLYRDGSLIYVGVAPRGIRRELQSHWRGERGACTEEATAFHYELTAAPEAVRREYLRSHMARYGGSLPPCNHPERHPWGDPHELS